MAPSIFDHQHHGIKCKIEKLHATAKEVAVCNAHPHKVQTAMVYNCFAICVQCTSTQSAKCNDVQLFCNLDKLGFHSHLSQDLSLGTLSSQQRSPGFKAIIWNFCFWTRCVLTALEIWLVAFCQSEITYKYSCVYNSKHSGILRESNNSARNQKRI